MVKKGPLRRVVGEEWVEIAKGIEKPIEVLECGHRQRIPIDAFGPYYSDRRRCGQCWKDAHPEPREEPQS